MNESETKQFRNLTAIVELANIRPIELTAAVIGPPPSTDATIELSLQSSIRIDRSSPVEFSVAVRFELGARKEGEKQEYAQFAYSATASYTLPAGAQIENNEIRPFAQHNTMIHVWPYMRAFVQSACGQLGIPPVVVPVFRVTGAPMAWQRIDEEASAQADDRPASVAPVPEG